MRVLSLRLVFVLGLVGCASSPGGLDDITTDLNGYLGTHLEARVKADGIPDRCINFEDGRSACEWYTERYFGQMRVWHQRTFIYDAQGVACGWTYRGFAGERTADHCEQ